MTPLVIATTLVVTVLATGFATGPLIRRAAPALMRTPRLTVGILGGVLLVWLVGLAAFGPTLAWALGAPTGLLPGASGEVCQRCLAAANPLPAELSLGAGIPAVILLALPVVLAVMMFVAGLRYRRQQHQHKQQLTSALQVSARKMQLAGHFVTVIPHDQPTAFAMADRRWGIVVSTALIRLLNAEEVTAVIAHEAAHVRQRHHLVTGILHGVFTPLRWVPLVNAVSTAIPQYLEMAADNAARQASCSSSGGCKHSR
jgi:Zn-dependent protease with chaperone function